MSTQRTNTGWALLLLTAFLMAALGLAQAQLVGLNTLKTSFTASPEMLTPVSGVSSTTLSWTVSGAVSVHIDNGVGDFVGVRGSVTVSPSETTVYTLTAVDARGHQRSKRLVVAVRDSIGVLAGSPRNAGDVDGFRRHARFSYPGGVTTDAAGNVYVTDTDNCEIRKVSVTGVVTTLAGAPCTGAAADGLGSAAAFVSPSSPVMAPGGGFFYVLDGPRSIRKVTLGGQVTTLALDWSHMTNLPTSYGFPISVSSFYANSITVDGEGNLLIGDYGMNIIDKVTPSGVVTLYAGVVFNWSPGADGPLASATFSYPFALSYDAASNSLYVVDYFGTCLRSVASGVVTTLAGVCTDFTAVDGVGSAARLSMIRSVLARDGVVYMVGADSALRRYDPASNAVTTLAGELGVVGNRDGRGVKAGFDGLGGIASMPGGGWVVSDTGNDAVRLIDANYEVRTLAGKLARVGYRDGVGSAAEFYFPHLLSKSQSSKTVYAYESTVNQLRKISPEGDVSTLTLTVADASSDAEKTVAPKGLAVDSKGVLYVADQGNVLRKVASDGSVTTIAGAYGAVGASDGAASAATLNTPITLLIDSADTLYWVENCAIRKITTAGVVTTLSAADSCASGSALSAAINAQGDIFETGFAADGLRKVSADGSVSLVNGFVDAAGNPVSPFMNASGELLVDLSGRIDFAYFDQTYILQLDPQSKLATTIIGNRYRDAYPHGKLPGFVPRINTVTLRADGDMLISVAGAILHLVP